MVVTGSWDGVVRVWAINEKGESEGKAQQKIEAPIMAMDWFDVRLSFTFLYETILYCITDQDGSKIFLGCADNHARVWDLASNTVAVCGTHDAPISTCNWIKVLYRLFNAALLVEME